VPLLAGLGVAACLLLLFATTHQTATRFDRLDDANIVVLYSDKVTKVIPTREKTVQTFLANAGVTLNDGDVVEPALDTPIEEDDFRINVYRAVPVLIQDTLTRTRTLSAAQSPRSIAEQAGITIYPEDEIDSTPSRDFLRDGIGRTLTIRRATPIILNLYGTSLPLRTQAKTVADLIADKQLVLAPDDKVQPSLDTPISTNMQLFITRFGVEVVTLGEAIAMPIQTIDDNSLSYGTTAIRQKGSEGKKSVTYQLEVRNGEEVSRTLLQEVVTQAPVVQIVARGTSGRFENFTADGIPARVFCGSPKQRNWKNINVNNAALGRAMAATKGWTGAQYNALLELFACESSWNERAGNPTSGAYGIPQSLPASKMADPAACGGAGYLTDPQIQLSWGLCYIQRRYGTPSAALDYHYRNNFY
jgi:uncharacterized protein YabE (DUF348 family)